MTSGSPQASFEIINWYVVVLSKVFSWFNPELSHEALFEKAEFWSPVFASTFAVALMAFVAYVSGFSRMKPEKMTDEEILPPKNFGLWAFLEMGWAVVVSTLESTLGEGQWKRFVTLLGGTFFVLLISNLSGVLPGFEPATASMSFTFACGLIIFLYFNFYGFKEAKFDYIKHLMGPIIWVAPLIFVIETIGIFARPISLSLRIFGNVTGDHSVFKIFSGLLSSVPFVPVPALFLAFGTFVACVQAFIFMTLSAVYIKIALDSKHH